ncbi:MAG: thioredoxin family protein [Bacteroidota bacterium]
MKKIPSDIIRNARSYQDYRKHIDELFEQGKTSGTDHSEAMLAYTKLNISRMRRLDKTTRLTEETLNHIKNIKQKTVWLVITEAWCGDAAQIIPVLNKMATQNSNIDLKFIYRDEHPSIMDAFLTNGSRSIPILITVNADTLEVINSWGPRPAEVQGMVMDAKAEAIAKPEESKKIWNEAKKNSQLWYARDKTKSIQSEVVDSII